MIGKSTLPKSYLDHVEEFFYDLFEAFGKGQDVESFSLKGSAEIIILDDRVNPYGINLPMIPSSPGLLSMLPEYVEKVHLKGFFIYKIAYMVDNDRWLFLFSKAGQFEQKIEHWLEEQVKWTEIFAAQ